MICNENEINYLNSFKADTAVVSEVISQLIIDLKKLNYPSDEIDEIMLSMDEAITNAVQETIEIQQLSKIHKNLKREITIRYKICTNEFDATIIDHGKGLDIKKMLKEIPDSKACNYHEQIYDYVENPKKNRLKIRLNGNELNLNGIGAGLKIILSFMDQLTIDLIDKKDAISDSVTNFTDGTILNMTRKRRYYEQRKSGKGLS
ncbi:MAG: ATP-binding protein [Spirochaetes bacterium]|nr:ATP-binding protein [Spirochaetota bacterium]